MPTRKPVEKMKPKSTPKSVGSSNKQRKPATPKPSSNFRSAFSTAKKNGQKTFTYKGNRYTTQTAAEKAKKQTLSQNERSAIKACDNYFEKKYSGKPTKSALEQWKSYQYEYTKQWAAQNKKK